MKESHLYRTTRLADSDLVEIWQYLAERNLDAANRVIDELASVCETLGNHSLLGEVFDHEREFLRRFTKGEYVVYYHTATEPITVVRVLHGARDSTGLI